MKISVLFAFVFSLFSLQEGDLHRSQHFDKQMFYKTMDSGNLLQVNDQFISIKTLSVPDRNAYEGALLMKEANLIQNKKIKLSLFKSGKLMLDSTIVNNNENCEFRFLRLIIQENSPPFLGYNKQISEDCKVIKKKFDGVPVLLQNIIRDYSKKEKTTTCLFPEFLKNE